MQHGDGIHFRIVECALFNHRQRAAGAFFCRLKDQNRRSGHRFARAAECARRAKQHRRVRVVTAGVHLSGVFRSKRKAGALGDRQRIHVGPQGNDSPGVPAGDAPDDARFREAAMLDGKRIELTLDQRRGSVLFEPQLGPAMNRAPQLDDPRGQSVVYFECHGDRSYRTGTFAPADEATRTQ